MKIKTLLKVVSPIVFAFLLFFISPAKNAEAVTAGGAPTAGGCQIVNFTLNPSLILAWELSPQCVSDTVSSPATGTLTPFGGGITTEGFNTQAITGIANVVAQTSSTTYTIVAYDSENNSTSASIAYNGAQHQGCIISSYSVSGSNNVYSISVNFPSTGDNGWQCYLYANGQQQGTSTFSYTVDASHSSEVTLLTQALQQSVGTNAFISLPSYVAPAPSQTATITVSQSPLTGGTWTVMPDTLQNQTSMTVTPASSGTKYTLTCNSAPSGYTCPAAQSLTAFPGGSYNFTITYVPVGVTVSANLTANGSAGPVSVTSGQSVALAWTSTNATSCNASANPFNTNWNGPVALSGSQSSGALTTNTTFSLNCSAGASNASSSVTVNVTGGLPDLIASAPTQNSATVSTPQTFTSTITNQGGSPTGAGFTNLFQISTASDGSSNLTSYPVAGMAALAVNGTATTSQSITFNSAGTWYIRVCADKSSAADVNGVITESNENNNCSSNGAGSWSAVTVGSGVASGPDLTAGNPSSSPSSPTSGTPTTFSSTISNIGDTSTGTSFSNFFQVSTTSDGSSGVTDLAPTSMATLGAGTSSPATSPSYSFPSTGTYYIRACADKTSSAGGGIVTESNEGNNCSNWTNITISGAGAVAATLSASPNYGCPGQSTLLTWTVSNADHCSAGTNYGSSDWGGYWSSQNPNRSNGTHTAVAALNGDVQFTLQCFDSVGNSTPTRYAFVFGGGEDGCAPPSATVSANPKTVLGGGYSDITWSNVINATECFSSNNPYSWPGNEWSQWNYDSQSLAGGTIRATNLQNTMQFILTCNGAYGTVSPFDTVSVTLPDLTANATSPTSAFIGTATNFSSLIKNIGAASTGSGFNNLFQVATSVNGAGTISTISDNALSALAANTSATVTSSPYTFSAGQCTAGTCSVRACADVNLNLTTAINESNEGNNCSPWTTVTVSSAPMSGNLSMNPTCIILSGASSCTSSATWTTTNPVATSSITSDTTDGGASAPNTIVANGNNGGPTAFVIPFSSRTFYLYNNGVKLSFVNAFSSCASGTSWDGSKCKTNPPNQCSNGATNWPTCSTNSSGSCINGATNPTACTTNGVGSCLNGADNPPTCTTKNNVCINGAVNPTLCTIDNTGKCLNGATNPPTCYNKNPLFKEN